MPFSGPLYWFRATLCSTWSLTVSVSFPWAWRWLRSRALRFLWPMLGISSFGLVPALPTTIAWITLLDPDIGMINVALKNLFHLDQGPFKYSQRAGNRLGEPDGPRHLDQSHAVDTRPSATWTPRSRKPSARRRREQLTNPLQSQPLPLMISPMMMVFALQLLRIIQSFETEYLSWACPWLFRLLKQIFKAFDQKSNSQIDGEATVGWMGPPC